MLIIALECGFMQSLCAHGIRCSFHNVQHIFLGQSLLMHVDAACIYIASRLLMDAANGSLLHRSPEAHV